MRLNQAFRLGLHSQLLGSASWLPTALFAASEQGAWYDPSDLTSMRQLSTGATAAAVASPVGFIADKRLMGGKTFDAFVAAQPELVTNGDFSSGAGWTLGTGWTISGGVAVGSGVPVGAAGRLIATGVTVPAGLFYQVVFEVVTATAGSISARVGNSSGTARTVPGVYTEIIFSGAGGEIGFERRNSDFSGTIDNVSVKLLPGNHATQATAAARPILGREPVGGRRNLLTYSEEFDNAAWGVGSVTPTANTTTDPLGGNTADTLTFIASGNSRIFQTITTAAVPYTFSVWLRADAPQSLRIGIPLTGSAGVVSVTTEWQRFNYTFTPSAGSNIIGIQNAVDAAARSVYAWGAQLETGSTATDYQKVVSQYDVTEAGVSDVYYLAFDGVDDSLATASIDFSATDEMSVFAGVRKLSDAAAGTVAELSASSAANNGTFGLFGPGSIGPTYGFHSRGTVRVISEPTGFSAPITNILTGLSDISADSCILRENGAEVASTTANQGTGNFLTYPLYIGRRGGATLPFNGRIYSLIVRGLLTSGDDLTNAETYVAGETGFTAPSITGVPTIGVSL
jgi:hypothetical protein